MGFFRETPNSLRRRDQEIEHLQSSETQESEDNVTGPLREHRYPIPLTSQVEQTKSKESLMRGCNKL